MRRGDLRRFGRLGIAVAVCLAVCAGSPAAYAVDAGSWLYEVERPVAGQGTQARQQAAREALLTVLTRITGLPSIPRSTTINRALAEPESYYDQFVFDRQRDEEGVDQLFLTLHFQPEAVLALAKAAQLPIWWSRRPQVVAWLVVEQAGQRRILSADDEHPLVEALRASAARRGLPLSLPLMDLQDRLNVSASDVWGKVAQTLDSASARYGADLVLMGRVSHGDAVDQSFRGDWEVWLDDQPLVANLRDLNVEPLADQAIDLIADQLVERYAVLSRGAGRLRLSVSGLDNVTSYAQMMSYLGGLEFVDAVQVVELNTKTIMLSIESSAQPEQLLQLLTFEGRLAEDVFYRGLGTRLVWRG